MLVVMQSIFKSHSFTIFQINLWRANIFYLMSLICALNSWGRWRAIDVEVPKLAVYQSNLNFAFGVRCSLFGLLFFFSPIKCLRLSFPSCLPSSLFFRESRVLFQFLTVGFISHTIGILNKTGFFFKRLVLRKINLETIFSRLTILQNSK